MAMYHSEYIQVFTQVFLLYMYTHIRTNNHQHLDTCVHAHKSSKLYIQVHIYIYRYNDVAVLQFLIGCCLQRSPAMGARKPD